MALIDEIRIGEGKRLELKEKLPSPLQLAKTVVAFSNTSGGKIVIGVNDKREIVGIDENKIFDLQDQIVSIIYENCYPIILPEIYSVNIDGKIVLVIEVFRGSLLPYYLRSKGKHRGTYVRIGATTRQADEQMIIELERQRMGKTFDEEENPEYELKNLDLTPIYREFEKIGKKADHQKLKNVKLIKSFHNRDLPTNALLIALGKFDNTDIKCARFKGTSMEVFIDKKEYTGNLFSVLENTINFLKNHLNLHAEIKGLRRVESYEIPVEALREALLNAIIHRDYTRNSDIKVAVYDDIVEIISPGGLPNGLTVEEVFTGRSELRNKVLARLFKELEYIEAWGSGVIRVAKMCREAGVDFEFKETGNFVSAVFYRPQKAKEKLENTGLTSESSENILKKYRKVSESIGKYRKVSEKEILILDYLQEHKKIKSIDVQNLLNVKEARARRILSEMAEKGLLKKVGKTRGSYYILNPNSE